MLIDYRIFLKRIRDIEVKVALCKNNFHWKILAEKFQATHEDIEKFYQESEIPADIAETIAHVRTLLVDKKAELPPEDLIV
jgi:DNA-binding ferritin-like protein